jgi:hypothetical protein
MTVDDGSSFDSRQQLDGDENSEVTLRSLATSPLWWHTAISVVMPILASAGDDAFALVIGPRSVIDLRQDGTTKRTSLRSILPGGVSKIELIRSGIREGLPPGYEKAKILRNWGREHMGDIGFKRGEPGARWCFLDGNDYYLTDSVASIAPAVIIDTTPWLLFEAYRGNNLAGLETSRLFSADAIVVAPHTHSADSYFKSYAGWVAEGRPPDPTSEWTPQENTWDPNARPDPIHYATPIPISATFGVTGLIVAGEWSDPAALEAARALLVARYDLKLGIWDLASNSTLRKTLLDASPVLPAPPAAVPVPKGAERRAEARVDAKVAAKEAERAAIAAATKRLGPLMELGWARRQEKQRGVLQLPLTEPMTRDFSDESFPLVLLALEITKRHTEVLGFIIMYNQVDFPAYLDEHRLVFEEIAHPAECRLGAGWPSLWRAPGGWGDDIDWEERAGLLAALTPRWVEVFAALVEECLSVRRASGYPVR